MTLLSALLTTAVAWYAQGGAKTLINPAFDRGLEGWKVEGDVHVDSRVDGKGSLRLGPGDGAVRQRYDVPGLRILWFGANLHSTGNADNARIRLQCFDKAGHILLNQSAHQDPKNGAAIYLKTQAHTKYVVVSIEKQGVGTLVVNDVLLKDDDKERVEHAPKLDLDVALRPFWQTDTVADESVLLLSKAGGIPGGNLLFAPTKILDVKDASFSKHFTEGKDFRIVGNTIEALTGSPIPVMRDTEISKTEFPWTPVDGRKVFVTYRHDGSWQGPVPPPQAERLPNTHRLLHAKQPLTIVAYGDSITLGVNVSGFKNVPPYMPPWPSLVAHGLAKSYGDRGIRMYNTGLGGMTSEWAKENAKDIVASLDPDLVLIGFGMNDFWSLTPAQFRANIEATVATIRAARPKCEFLLIASMKFDPAYTADPTYVGHLEGYTDGLRQLAGPGVAFFDMATLSDALYHVKSAKDLATDPMHPDDFLARIYAQGVLATIGIPK